MPRILHAEVGHVLWIGGPPGAGKTTLAWRLMRRHGLRWYGADTRTWEHVDRALAAGVPAARSWQELPPEQRWDAPPDELRARSLHRERGPMVVDDLRALPKSPLVVAEGSVVPAAAADPARAVWLLPRERPPNLLVRVLSETIEAEAREAGVPLARVDELDVDQVFADALAEGPRAETLDERRALLREANEALVAQARGYYARPWAEGDAESVVREFICECGDPACTATVRTTVGEAARRPLLELPC